jgi:arylsulfatase A-like enzyme
VELDLGPFDGTRVDVLLQIDPLPGPAPSLLAGGGGAPRVLWASPAVYGRLAPGEDPSPWDGAAAANDGDGGGPAPRRRGGDGAARPVNILLFGFDTLRYDAVGPHREGPSLTPHLDALAAEGDAWDAAFSTFNSTNPSFASIMTGLYGKNHGVYDLRTPLPAVHVTLAERFAAAGYDTFAVIAARHLGPRWSGLGRGFAEISTSEHIDAGELVADRALEWLAGRDGPWFAWLHFFDPHTPHTPPQPFGLGFRPAAAAGLGPVTGWFPFRQPGPREYVENVFAGHPELYDGEVAYLDRQFGRVLDFLASRGALDDTVVAVVADHGESLGEHDILCQHGGLHDQTTHVPLIVRWPERLLEGPEWLPRRGRRFAGLVQTIDLHPTLLAAAGLEPPPSDGLDLRRLTVEPIGAGPAGEPPGRRHVFAEHAERLGAMVRTRRWKYFVSERNPVVPDGPSLFDLERDPGETVNLAGRGLEIEADLAALLARWQATVRPAADAQPAPLTEEDRQQLRSLGYLR